MARHSLPLKPLLPDVFSRFLGPFGPRTQIEIDLHRTRARYALNGLAAVEHTVVIRPDEPEVGTALFAPARAQETRRLVTADGPGVLLEKSPPELARLRERMQRATADLKRIIQSVRRTGDGR